jgi:bacterioferritin
MKTISELVKSLSKSLDDNIDSISTEIDNTIGTEEPQDLSKITPDSGASEIIKLLKQAFCEEMLAWYQYIIIAPFLVGKERPSIQKDYFENAKEELEDHGYWLLERISQLGGNIEGIDRPECWNVVAPHKYIKPNSYNTKDSIQQMIEAEQGAIETYKNLINATKDTDPVTYNKAIEILADEEEHLQEMIDFLNDINSSSEC